jgi:hypothetical protein
MSPRHPPSIPSPTVRLLLVAACIGAPVATGCRSERIRQDCRLERETTIATTARAPSDVGVARGAGDSWLVAWSADGATRVVWIDGRPAVTGAPARVLREGPLTPLDRERDDRKAFWEEDDGVSLAAEALQVVSAGDGAALVALVQAPGPDRAGGAHAAFVPAPPLLAEPRAVRLGRAGPASDRITAAVLGTRALIAWHDVTSAGPRVRLAGLDLPLMGLAGTAELPGALARFHPSLAADGTSALLAWAEEAPLGGTPGLAIRAAPIGPDLAVGEPRLVVRIGLHDAALHLAAGPEGFGLAYRDDEDGDAVLEYHFLALDRGGAPLHPPARISRADGPRGPHLAWGGGLFCGATIRSFQRNLLVGLNRFDARGAKSGGEFQIYADKSDFTRVALAADGNAAVLVYGEDRQARGRLLASRMQCRAP